MYLLHHYLQNKNGAETNFEVYQYMKKKFFNILNLQTLEYQRSIGIKIWVREKKIR